MKTLILATLFAAPAAAQNVPYLVADVNPSGDSSPVEITAVGDQIFFDANDGANGRQPWVSDGTAAGTSLTKVVALPSTFPYMSSFTAVDGLLLFVADDGVNGSELWRSDGTSAGTFRLTDVFDPPSYLFEFEGKLFLNANSELWTSDGTPGGTGLFAQFGPGTKSTPFLGAQVGGRFFFNAHGSNTGHEPCVSDGTPGGTYLITDLFPGTNTSTSGPGVGFEGVYYFMARDGTAGKELYRSDGTAAGTWLVKDIRPGLLNSDPRDFCVSGGKLFFSANDGVSGKELWVTDGTEPGTNMVKDIFPLTSFAPDHVTRLVDVDGTLFFYGDNGPNGGELWKSDGTEPGTVMVVDLQPGPGDCQVDNTFAIGDEVYFTASSPAVGKELHKSDGTAAGTVPVFDLNPGSAGSDPSDIVIHGELIYFAAKHPTCGRELFAMKLCELQTPEVYCTAGTTASGCQAMIAASGIPSASSPTGFVVTVTGAEGNKDGLFFFAENGRQASPWGTGSSYQCVVPPVKRTSVQPGGGTNGACDSTFQLDFNALITAVPAKAPAVGATVQLQCWFRDPFNPSNQTTSLSDALEFTLCP